MVLSLTEVITHSVITQKGHVMRQCLDCVVIGRLWDGKEGWWSLTTLEDYIMDREITSE